MTQPSPRQSGPGVRTSDPVVDAPIRIRSRQQTTIKGGEPVSLSLAPDPTFGLLTAEVSEPFLGHLLGPDAKP